MGLRATWLVLVKDVRAQVRNRTILIIGLLAPLALSFVLNLVFGDAADESGPVTFDIGLVEPKAPPPPPGTFRSVVRQIAEGDFLDLHLYENEDTARQAIDKGEVGAVWITPAGLPARGAGGEIVVIGDVDAPNTVTVAEAIAKRYAGSSSSTEPPAAVLRPIEAKAAEVLDTTTSVTAGLALFFGFFVAGIPLTGLLEERSGGTLARLLVAPIPSGAIVAGKALAAMAVGMASLATLMLASTFLMGADWGPPAGALLLGAAFVLAAVGLMTAAGTTARTAEQASNVQGIVAMGLGLLGGAFVPLPAAEGSLLGQIRGVTPHGFFLDGLTQLRSDGLAATLPAVGALALIGIVFGAVGMRASTRALRG